MKVKKKKTLAQKIAEKEEAAEQARIEKMKRDEEEMEANTPEGKEPSINIDDNIKYCYFRQAG